MKQSDLLLGIAPDSPGERHRHETNAINASRNPREHWADTVETIVQRGMPSERHWGQWHEQYMALAVRGWRGRVSGPASP